MADIIELSSSDEINAAADLLTLMYDEQSRDDLHKQITDMVAEGWHLIGIMNENSQCMATVMYYVGTRLFCGKYLQSESLFIHPEARRKGYSSDLFDWLEAKAKQLQCDRIFLHSFVENANGHKFFYAQGYSIRGFAINKILTDKYAS